MLLLIVYWRCWWFSGFGALLICWVIVVGLCLVNLLLLVDIDGCGLGGCGFLLVDSFIMYFLLGD